MGNPNRGKKDGKLGELPRISEGASANLTPVRAFDGGLLLEFKTKFLGMLQEFFGIHK